MTRSILKRLEGTKGTHFGVVEKDRRFKPFLDMLDQRMATHFGDALTHWREHELALWQRFQGQQDSAVPGAEVLTERYPGGVQVVGNLPFGVASPMLIMWLKAMSANEGIFAHPRSSLILMFQSEVAQASSFLTA